MDQKDQEFIDLEGDLEDAERERQDGQARILELEVALGAEVETATETLRLATQYQAERDEAVAKLEDCMSSLSAVSEALKVTSAQRNEAVDAARALFDFIAAKYNDIEAATDLRCPHMRKLAVLVDWKRTRSGGGK